jgi:hypothetical protein
MQLAVVIVSVLVVLASSLFKLETFSATAKQVIAAVTALVAGVVTAWSTGQFDTATDVLQTVLVIYGLSQAVYQFLFDDGKVLSGVNTALEAVGAPKDGA